MAAALARPLLHAVHLLTFTVLLGTGLLLLLPGLRAEITGGYSLLIREAHRWGGVAFAALPAMIVARFGTRVLFGTARERTSRARWQDAHVAVTLVMGGVFTLTGFVIWGQRGLPEMMVDASHLTHDWLTYAATILVGVHLGEVGVATLVARVRSAATAGAGQSEDVT